MNTIIIPGYGDVDWYIEKAVKNWDEKYDLQPHIHRFGWNGDAGSYDEKWQAFEQKLLSVGKTAIIGISAGASVAVRALQEHPELVSKVITICGPLDASKMNPDTLHDKYPVLEQSLTHVRPGRIPAGRVMTIRQVHDSVVSVDAMYLEGARDERLRTMGHSFSIGWTMFTKGRLMAGFVHN